MTRPHVPEALLTLLGETTSTATARFGVPGTGLLRGNAIIQLWKTLFVGGLRNWKETGVYFMFYCTSKADLVPVYVGKGKLLDRILGHLGGSQYVDQVFAVYFGGIHGSPWLLGESIQARFSRLSIGLVLAGNPQMGTLEERFVTVLRPVTNSPFYSTADLERGLFGLEELAARWLTGSEISISPTDLEALRAAHEETAGKM